NGTLVPWDDAKIHIGSHVIHYGSAVFEGVRCYATPDGPAVFRLDAHTERLFNSAKIYRMDVPYSPADMNRALLETISPNHKEGYAEGIALDSEGYISEGSGENIFLVKNDTLVTPPLVSSVLPGITRDSVMALARRQGIPVVEQMMPREMLYIADELFMTGTAAEITPVRSVDKIAIGRRARGPVTEALQRAVFDVVECRAPRGLSAPGDGS